MDYRYKQLEQDLSALSSEFSELGSRLSEAAKDVTGGVLPSEHLIEQILTACTKFENVRGAVHNQAGSMLVSPLPKAGELVSIQSIASLLKTAASAEENKFSAEGEQERASSLLSRVLAISHRETGSFQPLQDCHAKVAELRNAISKVTWPERHPESESIIALRHPSTVLLNFVENLDNLEDEKWIALETTITEAYGKPLFVAASRGKLLAQQSPEQARHTPAPEKPVERKSTPEKLSEKTVTAPAQVERKDAPAAPVHPTPAPVAAPVAHAPAAPAPAAAPAAPAAVTPITAITVPTRPPAPAPVPPSAPPPQVAPAPPSPAAASSLSALASATEPVTVTDRKPVDSSDKGRKEPRLAAQAPQQPTRPEPTSQEQEQTGDEAASSSLAGDGSQRPQRWGFWRGNR